FSDSDCVGSSTYGLVCSVSAPPTPPAFKLVNNCARGCIDAYACGVMGRPFLVAHESRLPSVCQPSDWCARGVTPATSSLSAKTRARLAAAWLEIGRMEHASIAAFARFTLQLLAVGAPPDLVMAAQRAMADETNHAQLAFALAAAY